jgi:NADH dehydrogenase FAD-containing subunit
VTVDTIGLRSHITYDSLIVATGASQSYFGHREFAHDAPGMKTLDQALELLTSSQDFLCSPTVLPTPRTCPCRGTLVFP